MRWLLFIWRVTGVILLETRLASTVRPGVRLEDLLEVRLETFVDDRLEDLPATFVELRLELEEDLDCCTLPRELMVPLVGRPGVTWRLWVDEREEEALLPDG